MQLKIKVEAEELEAVRNEIANLAVSVTQRLKSMEELMQRLLNKEQDVEEQILRRIQSEIKFIKDRFGVSTEFEICGSSNAVLVITTGGSGATLGICKRTKDNVYEGMITAFWSALNREVPKHLTGLPPAELRHTESELKEVLGCDVTVINYPKCQ